MDFFDPQKQKRHAIRLAVGYALLGVVLVLATTILLYQAYGFGLDKDGRVIQNGLIFVSSHPSGAAIYINGKKFKDTTNTRMNLPSGQYVMELKRDGYRNWKRVVTSEGGTVERFDYPFLFPFSLQTKDVKQYSVAPSFSAQSVDRRWLLVSTAEPNKFDLYDLSQKKVSASTLTLSPEVLAAGTTTTGWQLVEWAKDNKHALLKRTYDKAGTPGSEYILVDRENPDQSQNLSVVFGFTPTAIELKSQTYDQYYLYDQASSQVFTASLKQPTPQPYVTGALGFASEGDVVVYATADGAEPGKVLIRIKEKDSQPFTVRQVAANTTYLYDLAVYENNLYLAAGAASENKVFVYKDPIGMFKRSPADPLIPVQILKVTAPTYVSFSANKEIALAESANQFSVYDAETKHAYTYQTAQPLDAPQVHATWMDGTHLTFTSGGKLTVLDFDGANVQQLEAASPSLLPAFDNNYHYVYVLSPGNSLTSTALMTPQDL